MKKHLTKIIVIAVVILLAGIYALRVSQYHDRRTLKRQAPTPIGVSVIPLKQEVIRDVIHATGTIRAVKREYCYFQTSGRVIDVKQVPDPHTKDGKRDVREGDRVKKGELLSQLDPRTLQQDVNVQKAALEEAKAKLDKCRIDGKRARQLWDKKAISKTEFEQYNLEQLKAEAAVKTAEARMAQAQIALEHTKIISPCDGIIAYMNVKRGYYSSTDNNAQSESELLQSIPFVILHDEEMELTAKIPAVYMDRVKVDQPVAILRPDTSIRELGKSTEDKVIMAKVYSVNPAVDPGGRSIQVKIRTDHPGALLRDGQFLSCWIITKEARDALVLPYNAIMYEDNEPYCFIADGSVAKLRTLKTGIEGKTSIQVTDGLAAGEKVIIEGNHRLVNDTPITIIASPTTDDLDK